MGGQSFDPSQEEVDHVLLPGDFPFVCADVLPGHLIEGEMEGAFTVEAMEDLPDVQGDPARSAEDIARQGLDPLTLPKDAADQLSCLTEVEGFDMDVVNRSPSVG